METGRFNFIFLALISTYIISTENTRYHVMNQCNGIFMSFLEKTLFAAVSKMEIRSTLCQMVITSVRWL